MGSPFSGAGDVRLNPINLGIAIPLEGSFGQLKKEVFLGFSGVVLALGRFLSVVGGGFFVGFFTLGGVGSGVDGFQLLDAHLGVDAGGLIRRLRPPAHPCGARRFSPV